MPVAQRADRSSRLSRPEFALISDYDLADIWGDLLDEHGHPADDLGGVHALVGLFLSACANSDQAGSSSTARSAAPWAQNLNEPPPSREPASKAAAHLRAELNAARKRSSP